VAQIEPITDSLRKRIGSGACHRARQDAEFERTGMYLQRVAGAATGPLTTTYLKMRDLY